MSFLRLKFIIFKRKFVFFEKKSGILETKSCILETKLAFFRKISITFDWSDGFSKFKISQKASVISVQGGIRNVRGGFFSPKK